MAVTNPDSKSGMRRGRRPAAKAGRGAATGASKRKRRAAAEPSAATATAFPIVGIGASAGGLEAFTQFLRALPPETGMAFVLVQHLEARHESMLTKLLSGATRMTVTEAKPGVRVQPNHVYVIPPNADISIGKGLLHVVRRKAPAGKHLPIDRFFRSLAEDQGTRAIGVILSGTASDGTLGLKAIKADGGFTFAQSPESAKFGGMPANAVAAGCVDCVLPPEGIARELAQISRHPYVGLPPSGEAAPILPAADEKCLQVFSLLRSASGVDFTFYKKSTIERRIARRMALHQIGDLKMYIKFLESHREEIDALYRDILIHVTSFFREPEVFRAFQTKILPRIFSGKQPGEAVRFWIPGCSTGEEAYTIAICLLEYLETRASATPIQIFGTDVSEQAIGKARAGIYPHNALAHISPERIRRFFTRINGHYQIDSSVRDICIMARHDLTRDPPFSRLDLVSCRNVLIYFEPVLQKKALASFHYALKDTGILLLGKSETLGRFADLFSPVDRKAKFFSKKRTAEASCEISPARHERLPARQKPQPGEAPPGFDLAREADRVVWERYSHAGLVINDELEILHIRGDISPYLRPAQGKATFNLLRMLREDLIFELRALIHKARTSRGASRRQGIRFRRNGHAREVEVNVEVRPLGRPGEKYFLILFELPRPGGARGLPRQTAGRQTRNVEEQQEALRLRNELAQTREYLQAIIQEQEPANEELKTANEEALSSMEELQSTNEELETAKEELQSSNEELITLNEQLQNRNSQLAQLTDDLTNVLSGVSIPILVLGGDRCIRWLTPTAETLLHLRPSDVGRPISNIRLGLHLPDLDAMVTDVIEWANHRELETQAENGRWYSVRMRPYRTAEQKIDGALVAFVDIDALKQSQQALRKEGNVLSAALNAANDLLVLVLDLEGRITRINHAFEELTGYSVDEVQGKHIWDLLLAPADADPAKESFAGALDGRARHGETDWLTKDGRRRLINWSNRAVPRDDRTVENVIITGIDITRQREAKEQARESEAVVQALLESAAQAILATTAEGRIVVANPAALNMFGYSREEMLRLAVEELIPRRFREQHTTDRTRWFAKPQNRPMGQAQDLAGLRKGGFEFPVEVSLSHIAARDGGLSVTFISDITERKKNEGTLRTYQQELQALTARLIVVQEAENKHMARELHDGLSQELAALSMEISVLLKAPAEVPGPLRRQLESLGARIGSLTQDVHGMSRQLHPAILDDLGLEAALRDECATFERQSGIPADFMADKVPSPLPEQVSLCLYRVVQESLRNIGKHARASAVQVRLTGSPEDVTLEVRDVGDGFDLKQVKGKGGLGLISMEERARLVGGQFAIQPEPGKGTQVKVYVPLKKKA